jgi:DNA-binding SARP family transcriptional activator
MKFGLLGPLLVCRNGDVLKLPGGKQRVLLAVLLLNAGRVVPLDELSDVLWGAEAPASARVSVQNYVKRLRIRLIVRSRRIRVDT